MAKATDPLSLLPDWCHKVVSGAYRVELAANAGGRRSQQSIQQNEESGNNSINHSNQRNFRKNQMMKVQSKQAAAADPAVDAGNNYPHVVSEARQRQAAETLDRKPTQPQPGALEKAAEKKKQN